MFKLTSQELSDIPLFTQMIEKPVNTKAKCLIFHNLSLKMVFAIWSF